MATVDIESDPFFELLTDALRAGPGSPQWRAAVERVRAGSASAAGGGDAVEEHKLLLLARERLEGGRAYRAVRAGPGFTRRVLGAIDAEASGRSRGPSTATVVGVAAGVVGVAVLALLGAMLFSGGHAPRQTLAELQADSFPNTVLSATAFDDAAPTGWKVAGPLPLAFNHTLIRPAPKPLPEGATGYCGAAVYAAVPLPADRAAAVEATFVLDRGDEAVIPQLFVSDDPNFNPDTATTPRELVWTAKTVGAEVQPQVVLPDGQFVGGGPAVPKGKPYAVRIAFNANFVTVDANGTRLYAGPHLLSATAPRTVGLRFLRRPGVKADRTQVTAIKVMTP